MARPHTEIDLGADPMDAAMSDFDRRSEQIEQDLNTLERTLKKLQQLLKTSVTASAKSYMDMIENQTSTTRGRLASLAEQNKKVAKDGQLGPASMKIRVTRFSKLATDFTSFLQRLEGVREEYRQKVEQELRVEVEGLGLTSRGEVEGIVREGRVEEVLEKASPEMRMQVEMIRERNKVFEKLNKEVAQLHEMFVELSFLTENQQGLINEIEQNVAEVQQDVGKAEEEIVEARRHQKSARKKQLIIAAIILVILAIIILIVVLQVT